MSERYGTCRGCNGRGEILKKDVVLLRSEKVPCGLCNGEGFSGDAMEDSGVDLSTQLDHERELRDIGYENGR